MATVLEKPNGDDTNTVVEPGSRILIVDDDRDICESLRDVLELETSCEVRLAFSRKQAVEIFTSYKPDLALVDVKLDKDNGLDLLAFFKKRAPDIICVVMTAYRDPDYAVTAVKNGADDFVYKPVNVPELLYALERFTQLQKLRRQNRANELRYRAAFEQAFQLMFVLDIQGRVLDLNPNALNAMGVAKDKVEGRVIWHLPLWGHALSEDGRNLQQLIEQALHQHVVRAQFGQPVVNGDAPLFYDVSVKAIDADLGQEHYIIVECRDISDIKAYEQKLLDWNDELEQMVAHRTRRLKLLIQSLRTENTERRLAEQRALQARAEAEQASLAKSEFLSCMSHELRTPMNAILGFAQLLELDAQALSADQAMGLSEIRKAGTHLLDLINSILDLSSIEAGRKQLHMSPCALDDLVRICLNMIGPLALQKQITVVPPVICGSMVMADDMALKQILINLLSNAIKYSKPGQQVEVLLQRQDDAKVCVCIKDHGPGIARDKLETIFQPFTGLAKSYSQEGTGIGLAVARRLALLMGTDIRVTSEPGQGSVFCLVLAIASQV